MNSSEKTNQVPLATDEQAAVKKAYVKPEFRHEKVFETMALACGKLQTTQGQCRFNRKSS